MASAEVAFWLSRIQVNPPRRKHFFRYQLHQFIWQAYPALPAGSRQPFLFTLPGQQDHNGVYCLVQSQVKPNWSTAKHQVSDNCLVLKSNYEVKSIHFEVRPGDQFFFQLQACPMKNKFQGRKKRGQKAPVFDQIGIEKWLIRRAELHGFNILRHEFSKEKIRVSRKPDQYTKNILLSDCRFSGFLEVNDEKKFAKTIMGGIGKKKIFGFGMLMLA
ncbi:MAG TPA: type I-E CRISPR-associated protein Cas6/Cse3/CasE [Desulfobulbus sp.]|nr:type I-E CRISPR-associated protein Cas6/Cse3/CasE [Desulfobulbus sp.]